MLGSSTRRPARTIARWLGCVGVVAGLSLDVIAPTASAAAPTTSAQQSDLFVTSPPDPVPAIPGAVATSTLIVGNIGANPLDVRITNQQVQLLENGHTRFLSGPDPRFAGHLTISPQSLTIPARHEQKVSISVSMPKTIAPDDYFLGFLVQPVINSPSIAAQNDIGGLVILNVPGARDRRLTAQYIGLPGLDLSFQSSVSGQLRAMSVGRATVQYSTTIEISGHPASQPSYLTEPVALLPPGLYRDTPVHASTWFGLGWYTFDTTLVYNRTSNTTGDVVASRTVVIINPLWFLVIPTVLFFVWLAVRRRRRRKRGAPRHAPKRRPKVTIGVTSKPRRKVAEKEPV